MGYQYSILILTKNEGQNIEYVVKSVDAEFQRLGISHEFVIVDGHSTDNTLEILKAVLPESGRVITQQGDCFAAAMREGFKACNGEYILLLDGDGSHSADHIEQFVAQGEQYALVVGSRFVNGGGGNLSSRHILSFILNHMFSMIVNLPIKDSSSGFRRYKRAELLKIVDSLQSRYFEVQIEIIDKLLGINDLVTEIPIFFHNRREGTSKANIIKYGMAFMKLLVRLLKNRRFYSTIKK